MVGEPGARTAVQVGDALGRVALELADEHGAEQRVVAEPAPLGVERDDEQVAALERAQHVGAVAALDDGVAERARQALEHRGAHQELARLGRLLGDDLVPQVVDEEAVVDRQAGQEGGAIAACRAA